MSKIISFQSQAFQSLQRNNFISLVLGVLTASHWNRSPWRSVQTFFSKACYSDTAAKHCKVLCHRVWSPCSQGQSLNGLEKNIEAGRWSRCFWLRKPDEESPVVKGVVCVEGRAVDIEPVFLCDTALKRRCRRCKAPIFNSIIHLLNYRYTFVLTPNRMDPSWEGAVGSGMQFVNVLKMYLKIHIFSLMVKS